MKTNATLLILCLLVPAAISAQGSRSDSSNVIAPWFVEKFQLRTGLFIPINDTKVSVDATGGQPGTVIDFETDLGFNANVNTFLGSAYWRATRRSRFSFTYYVINRSTTYTLQRDIVYNDFTYSVNASINSFFNTSIYQFSYGYAIFSKPKYELGLMIGTHLISGETGMSVNNANGSISDNNEFGFTAPLPDLGIWGGYAITDRMVLNFETSYLSATVYDVTGSILTYKVEVSYNVWKKLGVSLGYAGLNFDVDVTKPTANAQFAWAYNGPSVVVSYSFGKKYWNN